MSDYIELPVQSLELDKSNPRISYFLECFDPDAITSDTLALCLGTTSDECASLRESILKNGGIINPIIVEHNDGHYIVVEGNTRLQIYRDFLKKGIPGHWDKIQAIVYENLERNEMHAIRLQAHLVGPREWNAYDKAKYLYQLANVEYMSMDQIVAYCGGTSKASEIKHMIQAYDDMQKYYRPICGDESQFNPKKFQGFVELQRSTILDALKVHGYTKHDFAEWIRDERISVLADVRKIPEILNSEKASKAFFKYDSEHARKILASEEVSTDDLKDVPYEILAKELRKRMDNLPYSELQMLRSDAEYEKKVEALEDVVSSIKLILEDL